MMKLNLAPLLVMTIVPLVALFSVPREIEVREHGSIIREYDNRASENMKAYIAERIRLHKEMFGDSGPKEINLF